MLSYRHINDLAPAAETVHGILAEQSAEFHPGESVIRARRIRPYGRLYAEISLCLRRKCGVVRIAHDHRLAVPHIPKLGKARVFFVQRLVGVDLLVYARHRLSA